MNTMQRVHENQGWAAPAGWNPGMVALEDPESWGNKMDEPVLISIVDDNPSVLKSLDRLLKSLGFKVQAFASAEDFLQSGDQSNTACLILDVRLPGMNGLELLRQLATAMSDIPIVFVSAHDDAEVKDQALAAGAVAFLSKPFSEDVLLKAVNSALK